MNATIYQQQLDVKQATILNASISLFLSWDIHKVSMQQIAQAAGVSKSCLYRYYANKADVLADLLLDQQWMIEQLLMLSERMPIDDFLECYFVKLGQNLAYFRLMQRIRRYLLKQDSQDSLLFRQYIQQRALQHEQLNKILKIPHSRHLYAQCLAILEGSMHLMQDKQFLQFAPIPSFYEQLIRQAIASSKQ